MYYRYTISDKSNTVAIMAWPYDNSDLQNYFEDEVVPKKEETRRIISVLKADLEVLFSWIKYREPRLYQQVAHVGSYYQGLKVRRSDEFDYSLFIDISGPWSVCPEFGVYYGFKGCNSDLEHKAHTIPQDRGDGVDTNLHITMNKKLELEEKNRPLVSPGIGYFTVKLSPRDEDDFSDMSYCGDLVPRYVKMKLKEVLMELLEEHGFPSDFQGEFASEFLNHTLLVK